MSVICSRSSAVGVLTDYTIEEPGYVDGFETDLPESVVDQVVGLLSWDQAVAIFVDAGRCRFRIAGGSVTSLEGQYSTDPPCEVL